MSTEPDGYYYADEIPAGSRVRDPDWVDRYAVVTHVSEETPHTVRVHWDDGASCVHPNGAIFTRG